MNYQYRYGTGTREAMATLYKQGGFGRFYQGLPYALMQAPLSRFGDTAANTGVLAIFAVTNPNMPIGLRTAVASMAGSLWRILITPVDTLKTTLQVQGKEAMDMLGNKIKKEGVIGLYTRGLGTRLLTNGIQASLFSVVWKVL